MVHGHADHAHTVAKALARLVLCQPCALDKEANQKLLKEEDAEGMTYFLKIHQPYFSSTSSYYYLMRDLDWKKMCASSSYLIINNNNNSTTILGLL